MTAAASGSAVADPAPAPDSDPGGETIVIHGDPLPSSLGAVHLDRDEVGSLPGTGGDLMQSLTVMPGVASTGVPLGANGIVIRGSSPQDSKILIDDFEIPVLYHSLGFRSIPRTEAIDSLEYIPGGFDVRYGGATSGIVSLTTRGGDDHPRVELDNSTGDVGALVQGRAGDLRYMVAARRSVLDLVLPLVLPNNLELSFVTFPRYYDEQLRLDYKLSEHWDVRVSSIGSDDELALYGDKQRSLDQHFLQRTRFIRGIAAALFHDGLWGAKLAVSGIAEDQRTETGAVQHIDISSPALTARAELERDNEQLAGLTNVVWRIGAEAVHTHYTADVATPTETLEGEPAGASDPNDAALSFRGHLTTNDSAVWTAFAANLDDRIRATIGMRIDAYAHDTPLQPRGELSIRLTPELVARVSAGAYARPPEYQSELLATGLVAERATQLIAGTTYEPLAGARVQTSLYYTDRRDLIFRDATGDLVNTGSGTTYGAEIAAIIRHGPWFGSLVYSYSHSTRVDAPGLPARLFDYDQPHNLELLGNYRLGGRDHGWTFGARFRLLSGLPYTPIVASVFDSDRNLYTPTYGPVNSARAELHHELDVRIERRSLWHGIQLTRYLDVQNVYLNQSAITYLYSYDYTKRTALSWLPIVPVIGVRAEF